MDPIADMLVQIKNAGAVGRDTVYVPFSNIKFEIAKILADKCYVKAVSQKGKKVGKTLEIELAYTGEQAPRIQGLKRISKPSRRVYYGAKHIKQIRGGFGSIVLSTPKGILTGDDARKAHVGGEALFTIW
jgi:small subunit ribosomal protein S8